MRQANSLCAYGELTDELTRDKFIFSLNEDHMGADNLKKTLQDVVVEARLIESAKQTNKLIVDSSKRTDEEVHWTDVRHSQMKLHRETETSFWFWDWRAAHPWKVRSAKRPVRFVVTMTIFKLKSVFESTIFHTPSFQY